MRDRGPIDFYQKEKSKFELKRDQTKQKIHRLSAFRLSLFLIVSLIIYFYPGNSAGLVATIVVGVIGFIALVVKHQSLKEKRKLFERLIEINEIEINVQNGRFDSLYEGAEYMDALHYFSNDIDLFGKGSFFQYLNRTATVAGRQKLVEQLLNNDPERIEPKQEVIRELSQMVTWRQRFLALANLVKTEIEDKTIITWIHNFNTFLPAALKYLPHIYGPISLIILILTGMGVLAYPVTVSWFFLGLLITLPFLKRINQRYVFAGSLKNTFKQYHALLTEIEIVTLSAEISREQQNMINSSHKKASLIFLEFSKILDAFDQRNNMLFGVLGNGFFLWDIRLTGKIDAWVQSYRHQVESWFEVIAFFDAQISLANYAYNHPDHNFPVVGQNDEVINASQMGHPLLPRTQRVCNDILIKKQEFHIVTGANMAGKSTFLRTVSLGLVMANTGLPVCASRMVYSPVKLITSMRTSDSLAEESSYFYAEILRLRFIVDNIKKDDYFIILDEILKGTNSKDKAEGSLKFIEKLVLSGSTGIIATHDLSLCEIEKKHPQIKNKYFDAEIKEGELFFDYQLREGICSNMNASFLLKKMEII